MITMITMITIQGARLVSPQAATGPPLVAGQGTAWVPTRFFTHLSFMVKITKTIMIMIIITIFFLSGGGGYIIQSPTQPVNPIEVFPVASPGRHRLQDHHHHRYLLCYCHMYHYDLDQQGTPTRAWSPESKA